MNLLEQSKTDMRRLANPERARVSRSYFKTGKGEYGEGDVFLGLAVPQMRKLARDYAAFAMEDLERLLASEVHEERGLALLVLVNRFRKADAAERKRIYGFYMKHTAAVNNWDLVDCSAPYIVGPYLDGRDRRVLVKLARSRNVWERRIAILATHHFIRQGQPEETLRIAEMLLGDEHDLIHKAAGWMLREVGKRCGEEVEAAFLEKHCRAMPRTMLRYAVERFPAPRRAYFLRK